MATPVARPRARRGNKHLALNRFGGAALAAGLALVVYLNALLVPFVYDDQETVVLNPSIVDLSNVRFILSHSPFRPVVNASYALDHAIWGHTPFGYHLTNVLLHATLVVSSFCSCGVPAPTPECAWEVPASRSPWTIGLPSAVPSCSPCTR